MVGSRPYNQRFHQKSMHQHHNNNSNNNNRPKNNFKHMNGHGRDRHDRQLAPRQQNTRFQAKTPAKVHKRNEAKHPFSPFDRRRLQPKWTTIRRVGPGLVNGINSCFLNSVLQCLTYTAPLAQYLLTENHRSTCSLPGFCALCAMESHVRRVFESSAKRSAILPKIFIANLRAISKTLKPRQQEDAHEFLMFLFSKVQDALLYGMDNLPPNAQQLTMLHSVFGGRLQSQLRCLSCKYRSNSFEPLLNLSVGVHKASTLDHALKMFFGTEKIGFDDPDNRYNCSACKRRVKAKKQLSINELPMMLPIHLNRFAFDLHYGSSRKVTRYIKYPEHLDMSAYISPEHKNNPKNIASSYHLYAVLVHVGSSCHSGHYYAYVKNSDGKWYCMDDEDVRLVNDREPFEQKAYILFYANDASSVPADTPVVVGTAAAAVAAATVAVPSPSNSTAAITTATATTTTTTTTTTTITTTPTSAGTNVGETNGVLKRKREQETVDEETKQKSKVRIVKDEKINRQNKEHDYVQGTSKTVYSNRPEAWFVRAANLPYRSLRESRSIKYNA